MKWPSIYIPVATPEERDAHQNTLEITGHYDLSPLLRCGFLVHASPGCARIIEESDPETSRKNIEKVKKPVQITRWRILECSSGYRNGAGLASMSGTLSWNLLLGLEIKK